MDEDQKDVRQTFADRRSDKPVRSPPSLRTCPCSNELLGKAARKNETPCPRLRNAGSMGSVIVRRQQRTVGRNCCRRLRALDAVFRSPFLRSSAEGYRREKLLHRLPLRLYSVLRASSLF
ncbi:hypothetical protein H106_01719 [Trichophyton rubrum CBS 735.88]|nr:hypothetical protein H106_01719 [Trichophyton rubrum CBS 735.88]